MVSRDSHVGQPEVGQDPVIHSAHSPPTMPLDWLRRGEPFVRYRVLTDLREVPDTDPELRTIRESIAGCGPVKRLLARRNEHGYWGTPKDIRTWWPKKGTTFWVLGVLADLGLTRDDEGISDACEYVFSTQLPDGAFGWGPPPTAGECFTGILVEALANLGYLDDSRLRSAFDWLLERQRLDGGFWCKNTGQPGGPRETEPSCAYGTLCVLGALVRHPQLRQSELAARSAAYLLRCWDNRGKIRYAGHDSQIGTGWEKLKYPFTDYRILKYLDVLTQVDAVRTDDRLTSMMELLMSKRDKDNRFTPESIHEAWSEFGFGQKKLPSRWITFLAYRIAKRLR
jgi:hypothetical protein